MPEAFPRINRGVDIASNGVDKGLQGINDARGYLSAINQRVDTYQGIVNDAQNRNQDVNNRLQNNLQTATQSASKTSENNIKFSPMSTDGNSNKASFDSEDANAMESSLSKGYCLYHNIQTSKQKVRKII